MLVNSIVRNNVGVRNLLKTSPPPEWSTHYQLRRFVLFLLLNILFGVLAVKVSAGEQDPHQGLQHYQTLSSQGHFRLQLQPKSSIELNTVHSWQARIIVQQPGSAFAHRFSQLTAADIQISGGMPGHEHGFPTQPVVSKIINRSPTQLDFLVAGIKFQMWGQWVIRVNLAAEKDVAEINLNLLP
ncbi:hypothetical protein [Thalassotalea sp. ND16A]|uniref:hypothetical protein n=1 Tax=Thalassotalea sp. ND16A TaxID=1535422 RepID=UPI00051A1BB5|nr:hypothetical protein [Thalassotalea sp. ND16A]KGJ96051.1 hypothetical protein ND16A_1110 [Thalassotalea sp. ND16A]